MKTTCLRCFVLLACCALMIGVTACDDKRQPPKSPTQKAAPRTPPKKDVSTRETKPSSLPQWFEYAFKKCKIAGAGSRPRECDGVDAQIDILLVKQGPKALPILLPYLTDERENMRLLSIWWLVSNVPKTTLHLTARTPSLVSRETAASLLKSVVTNGTRTRGGHVYCELAVHLGMLTGQRELVWSTLNALKDDRVKANGVGALMRYDRMASFASIKSYANAPIQSPLRRAAVAAPLRMPSWTGEERAVLCPWYASFWPKSVDVFDDLIAQGLMRCGGPSITTLIDEATRRLEQKTYGGALAIKMGEICARRGGGAKKRLLDGQCARVKAFFNKAIVQKELSLKHRKRMLFQLMMMGDTSSLTRHTRDSDTQLALEAKRLLKTHQKLKTLNKKTKKERP